MAHLSRTRSLLSFVLGLGALLCACGASAQDHRAWQHGIDLIPVGEKLLLVWGSAGNPPRPVHKGNWRHDIYYAWLEANDAAAAPVAPRILVSMPEAQEPPSAAINRKGTILVTSEDGNGGINQRAGLWDSSMRVLRKYPITIRRGGHSGHAAAMGDRFLVAYGEGWVDGGGWQGLGTGADLHARVVDNNGELRREVAIAAGQRDSWPLVAGSDRNWLVVWQRYPGLTLQYALIDTSGSVARQGRIIDGLPLRYAYDVAYSPALAAYVVAGTSRERGFLALVGLSGEILRTETGLPPMASESRVVLGSDGSGPVAAYPVAPSGVAVLRLAAGAIALAKLIDHPHAWDYAGTAGLFVAPGRLLFATLTTAGLKLIPVSLNP